LPVDPIQGPSVHWATDYEGLGNSYGYSVHNARARAALEAAGVKPDPEAPTAFHVAPAHLFRPVPGKRNVLFMAWETEDLPEGHRRGMARADALVVTASFLVDVARKAFPEKPVFHCPLGVDTATYGFRRREYPLGRPFRFLWVGAPNARKGWELVLQAWRAFEGEPRVELYLKTTMTEHFERRGNVTFDSRNLPCNHLAALYHSAHAFLFPSFGEGFGLTMAEAMATGLPVAFTPGSSLNDLADDRCGFPLRSRMVAAWATPEGGLSTAAEAPGPGAVRTRLAQADPADLARVMGRMFRHYRHALKRGERAARRIRGRFTWAHTGRRLAAILKEVEGPCPVQTCARGTK
jgi:glycosyltransferase involved in cell wall biosynthesis